MAKKKGCLFGLILVSMILYFFTSCQFFENDVKDFMEKYTETAAVEEHKISVKTYEDAAKNLSISSFEDAEISLYMRNPKKYTLTPSVTFKNLAETISRSSVTITQKDINSLTLKLPQDFLIPSDEGKDISAEISLYEPMSGRTFEKYTVPLYCNTVPPVILNPTVVNNGGNSFVIAFDMPNDEEVAIRHKDISEVVIEGVSYPVEVTTTTDAEGIGHAVYNFTDSHFTRSWNSSYIIINSKEFNQTSNSVYFETGVPFAAMDKEFTLILKDRAGLSSTVKASTSISKLMKPQIKDQNGTAISESGTAGIPYDEETEKGSIKIVPPTQDHLGNPVSGSTVYYTIYESTGSGKIYATGTTTEEKTIELPQNTYRTEAYATLTNYENSATASVRFRFVNNLIFVKAGSENGDGSEIAPYSTITQVLEDINGRANKDTKYTIYVEGDLGEDLSITGPINTDELIITKNPKASATPSVKSIDIAASLPDDFKLSISNLNVNGSAASGIKYSAAFNLPLTNVSISNATGKGLEITAGSVTYTGGTISGSGTDGISSTNADLTCSDITVSGSGAKGINISGGTIDFDNVSVSDSGTDGISLTDVELSSSTLTVGNSTAKGINISGGTIDFDDVSVSDSGSDGISLTNADLTSSTLTVSGSGAKGISISGGTHNFTNVTVSGSTSDGLKLSAGTLTASSLSVTGSAGRGIELAGGSLSLTDGNISQNLNGGINVAAAATLNIKGAVTVQNNTIPASPSPAKANVILAAGKKINVTGALSTGSSIGVSIASSDLPAAIGGKYSFTNGYGTYNSVTPTTYFTNDLSGYDLVPNSGEAAIGLGGATGDMPYTAADYRISFTATELDGTSPVTGMYFGSQKSILLTPSVELSGSSIAHTVSGGVLTIGGIDASLSLAAYNGGVKVMNIPAANLTDGGSGKLKLLLPEFAYKGNYTIKIIATYLGLTHESNFALAVDYSAENAAQYISSLNDAGTYNVVVEGPVGSGYTAGSEEGLAKVANAIKSLTMGSDRGVRINLDATGTINSSNIESYNGGQYFNSLGALLSIQLPDWMQYLITNLFLDCENMTSISIPDSVQLIANDAFNGCSSLTEITLPAAICGTSDYHGIMASAFSCCYALETINFTGTTTQWKQTKRAAGWHSGVPATVVHCVDGDCGLDAIPSLTGGVIVPGSSWTSVTNSEVFIAGRNFTFDNLWISDHETTQAEYVAIMGTNPSYFDGSEGKEPDAGEIQDKRPVECVSWYEALVYCNKRSMAEGLTPCYIMRKASDTTVLSTNPAAWGTVPTSDDTRWNEVTCNFNANGYRLPTEAEWEYCARGGNLTGEQFTYSGTNNIGEIGNYAWVYGISNVHSKTHEIRKKTPNGKGLYDMTGNVSEWCWDYYNSIDASTPAPGATYASTDSYRVVRGGAWNDEMSSQYKVSSRWGNNPTDIRNGIGFRVVRNAN